MGAMKKIENLVKSEANSTPDSSENNNIEEILSTPLISEMQAQPLSSTMAKQKQIIDIFKASS